MDSHKKTKELLAMLKDEIPEENIRLVQAKVESFFNKKEQPVEKKRTRTNANYGRAGSLLRNAT